MTYSEELLKAIQEDRKNGLTYNEIMIKHGLASNNAIKIALDKTLGGDSKYRGRHKERYHELKNIEQKYKALLKVVNKLKEQLTICSEQLEEITRCFY